MTYALLALQFATLVALAILLLRRPAGAPAEDPRLAQMLAADLPARFTRLEAQADQLNQHLRGELSQLRNDAAVSSAALRSEVLGSIDTLGKTLHTNLDSFRGDDAAAAERLRLAVDAQMAALTQRFTAFTAETNAAALQSREAMHSRLNELGAAQTAHQERLHTTLQTRLDALNQTNAAKLEEMRLTVDEKLHTTLHTRLTESFGLVTDKLTKVHEGLGEMSSMTSDIKSLSRIFSNVKTRGGVAEEMVETLLEEVLAPGQYQRNVNVRPGTQEVVEFAVKHPGLGDEVWLPIDAKFPREDWERLESANESGDTVQIEAARKGFDNAIRAQAKLICSKYINEPITTPYAIMFLPTESMYSEVLRRDGLQAYMHQNCRVMVAGPTNLYALLTSFRLGFRMLNLQRKGDEVWKVLAATQTEFGKFGGLIDKMDKQVGTVQNTIRDLGVRSRAINRQLRDVSVTEADELLPAATTPGAFDGLLPMLAANDDE